MWLGCLLGERLGSEDREGRVRCRVEGFIEGRVCGTKRRECFISLITGSREELQCLVVREE